MNPIAAYLNPRPETLVTERRSPIQRLREDSIFQGWGPRL